MAEGNRKLLFLLVVLSIAGTTRATPSAFFGFGDSYADTGNQLHIVSSWKYPYGITWPGYPTGRFGNGHIQTDYLAEKLGLPSPTPYVEYTDNGSSIATGANLALGGAGITYAIGALPLGTQLDNFELLLRNASYSKSFLADAVTLFSVVGDDYNVNYTAAEFQDVIQEVVEGIYLALERLYDLGLRNILVANLPPINCLPEETAPSNYTTCNASVKSLIELHNTLLLQSVQKLNQFPNANFLILDENAAFSYILNNTAQYGITEQFAPCCEPYNASEHSCGDVDLIGIPHYSLCNDTTAYVYWDGNHPVESTWKYVVDLFYNTSGFVIGATTLESWLNENSLRSPAPASAPAPAYGGALGELYTAYEALLPDSSYGESIGLLQAINLEEYLTGVPEQTVTIFLPTDLAWFTTSSSAIILIYGTDQLLNVTEYHIVEGYHDSTQLLRSATTHLTTISGENLTVTSILGQVLVGSKHALVVDPDVYNVESQIVVHGISKVLLPPSLQ